MSGRNGDKSRFRINEKRKLAKRIRTRNLLSALAPATPAAPKKGRRTGLGR